MWLLGKVCKAIFHVFSDGQVAARYAPYFMFETCRQKQSVWYWRRRGSFYESQIGGSIFKLATRMATGGRSGGMPMLY